MTPDPVRPRAFADHFSRDPAAYARFRPRYPDALFAWLGSLARPGTAWDCGTGNGQAAVPLARHFRVVLASDPSVGQLRAAEPAAGVHYFAATGEAAPIRTGSVDLITIAQALHWIDVGRLVAEAGRVLAPGGAMAVVGYGILEMDPPFDGLVNRFYHETVGPYWPAERRIVEEGYRSVPLPIEEVTPPPLAMEAALTLEGLTGYIRTWSAVGRYLKKERSDPVMQLEPELARLWGDPEIPRRVRWPLAIRAGRWVRG